MEVGQSVQYFTQRTQSNGRRLDKPEPVGPLAAVVTGVNTNGSLSLAVFRPSGGSFVAFEVTQEPTTPVQHYWRQIPAIEG